MRKQVIEVGDETFTFEIYKGDVVAVNVKHFPALTRDAKPGLEQRIRKLREPKAEDSIWTRAYEDTQESWWDYATELAAEYDVDPIFSAGRSGGWLVTRVNLSLLLALENDASVCGNCATLHEAHPRGKCLFSPTKFKSGDSSALDRLRELKQFVTRIEETLNGVDEWFTGNYENALQEYEEREKEAEARPA